LIRALSIGYQLNICEINRSSIPPHVSFAEDGAFDNARHQIVAYAKTDAP